MPLKVLVVEDEPHVAELIQAILEGAGNSCKLASDADEADRLLKDHPFDAVTLDIGMPGRSGLEWLESLAGHRPELARRTLVITGMPLQQGAFQRMARCGAGFLAKPFSVDALHEAMRAQVK